MNDDDTNPLAGLDLDAWAAPPPPGGLADRVVARVAATDEAIAVVARRRRVKRRWLLAGGLAAALAAAAVAFVVVPHPGPDAAGSGALVADKPQQLAVGGAVANLEPGADVTWQRSGDAIHVAQRAGSATWKVERDQHLVLDIGAAVASIDASNATLRVETRMNPSDTRTLGVTTVTAAAVALVTVIVYEGHVKVSGAGQTIVVERGSTVEVVPGQAPHALNNVAGVPGLPVMPSPPGPPVDQEPIPELIVPIGENITIHDPRGRLRVAVAPDCAGETKLVWPTGDASRPMEVSEVSFSHTCHGIDQHGSIKLVKDPGFGVLISPVDGAVGTDTVHLIGAAVPARAQVTIDSTVVATQHNTPWTIDLPYRSLFAVRIDAGTDDVHYYIRRMATPRNLPAGEVTIGAGESATIHEISGAVRVRIEKGCRVGSLQWFVQPGSTSNLDLHTDLVPALTPGAYSYVQRCEREDAGKTYNGTITVLQDDGRAVGVINLIGAWTAPLSVRGTYTTTGTTVQVEGVAASKVDGSAEGVFTAKGITPATPGVLAVRFDVPGKGAHVIVMRHAKGDSPTRLSPMLIQILMTRIDAELQGCVPGHKARETIKFTVRADGSVHDIATTTASGADCIENLVASQRFPKTGSATRARYVLDPRRTACDPDELVKAGLSAESVGNHGAALAKLDAALGCRFDTHTLQLSFMAACNGENAQRAQKYWKRMTEDMRAHMLQICLHNHITREELDE